MKIPFFKFLTYFFGHVIVKTPSDIFLVIFAASTAHGKEIVRSN